MTSKERVLTALQNQEPDRVPWVEAYVHKKIGEALLGRSVENLPGEARIYPEFLEVLALDNISYNFAPPRFARIEKQGDLVQVGEGQLKTWQDLEKCRKELPDIGAKDYYQPAEEYLMKFKGDYAALAGIRFGPSNTYLSMGIEHFSYMIFDDPALVHSVMEMFSDYSIRLLEIIQNMDFDVIYVSDDLAFKTGTFISRKHMEEFFYPYMKKVAAKIQKPWIFHSCGNINSILDDLLALGMDGISNFEPGPMDIFQVKKDYGDKICIMGNIDLHHTLTTGTTEETELEVKEKIQRVGLGGGYILATSNGIASYCKPENIATMNKILLKYGKYPLNSN